MRSLAALLVVLLAVSAAGVGAGHSADDRAARPHSVSEAAPALGPANQTAANATVSDTTEMHLSLRENGNARWNVTERYVLRGDDEVEAFRRLATDYENGNADLGLSRATFERVVERVNASSDRPMALRSVDRSARVRDNGTVGVLTLSFTWTNFTQVRENRIVLGDAFWIGSGTWLPTLNEDQALAIAVPDSYYISGASPSDGTIYNGTVLRYEGPQTFERGDFRVTYSPKSTETTPSTGLIDFSSTWGLVFVVLLFSGGFGAYALSRHRRADPDPTPDSATESDAATADPSPAASPPADDGANDPATDDDATATELLSDEERVLRLLRENDGRMKQGQIVKETNWSNAKVSQLLSKMDDNDAVDKLRIGRENLITLPDEDVTDVE